MSKSNSPTIAWRLWAVDLCDVSSESVPNKDARRFSGYNFEHAEVYLSGSAVNALLEVPDAARGHGT